MRPASEKVASTRRDTRLFTQLASELLSEGVPVRFRAEGQSMSPALEGGEVLTVAPLGDRPLEPRQIVLARSDDGVKAHRIVAKVEESSQLEIKGDAGLESERVALAGVLGRVIHSERDGQMNRLDTRGSYWLAAIRTIKKRATRAMALRLKGGATTAAVALAVVSASAFVAAPVARAQSTDLALTATASSPVEAGATITYTETVTNNGPNSATTVVLYQQTPTNTTYKSITAPTGWTCTNPGNGKAGAVTCTDGSNFAANATASFTFVVTVLSGTNAPAAGSTIYNWANVTSSTADTAPANNAVTVGSVVVVKNDADLGVSVSASPATVFVNSPLTYTIQVQNSGPNATTASTLTDALPTGFAYGSVAATPSTVSCTGGATTTCSLGALASGATATITITGTSGGTAATLTNSPALSGTAPTDPNSSNDTATVITTVQPLACATPGNDGAVTSLTGIVNTYFPPANATESIAAGSATATIALGAANAGGAQTAIAKGDLLLIIQTQGASINKDNGSDYGDGVSGDPAYGATNYNSVGNYEFITAGSAVAKTGGTLTVVGAGANGGLLNAYSNAPATTTQGASTFQVIRVPQYSSVTLGPALAALPWTGAVGGVLAIDVANQLQLNSATVALDSAGFRGGGGRILTGNATTNATDYVTSSTLNVNGGKGEGVAGTPAYVAPVGFTPTSTATATGQANDGYPAGSMARGAPGNAGGGATDGDPKANDENAGGGGGANGGLGGNGGFAWQSAGIGGGFGGYSFPATTSSIVMGGGAGAGSTNDGSYYIPSTSTGGADCGASCTGIYSSGAPGGGIAIIRAGYITGTGTITANGGNALEPENDGGGGGGAGGSILVFSNSGTLSGLTVAANGGAGGDTWRTDPPGTFPGNRHGPGGGGGGGVIFLSSTPASAAVNPGMPGYSTTALDPYGATSGTAGIIGQTFSVTQAPGTQSGGYCSSADLSVTDVGTPNPVAPGGTITYTQVVTNNSAMDAVNNVYSTTVPPNATFTSFSAPTGWTCVTPAVGASGIITCTNPDMAGSSSANFSLVVGVPSGTASGAQILNTASIGSGTNDPNLANNTASVLTLVSAATMADVQLTKTANSSVVQAGGTIVYTIVVKNNGPAAAATNTFTDATPGTTTFKSITQTGTAWTCTTPAVGATGTVSCTNSSLAVSGMTTFTLTVTVPAATASGTVITNSALVSSNTPDAFPSNNIASASTTVASATQNNLSITETATPYPVYAGNNVTFNFTVTNAGPAAAATVTVSGTTPTGTQFVGGSAPTGWTCTTIPPVGGAGNFSCSAAAFPAGSTAPFSLVVTVPAGTAGGTQISQTVNVTETGATDISTSNNSATASTVVAGLTQADVAIVKTAAPEPVDQGTTLVYTLQVTNGGPATAQGVTASDPLPSQVTFVSATSTQGTCTQTSGTVNCTIGSMTNGSNVVITINVTASVFAAGTAVANTATVNTTSSDPNTTNNFSSVLSTIISPTAVNITGFRAVAQSGRGVMLEWRTKSELRNLGFHIYRDDATGHHRVTPSLIAGAALFARGAQPQHAAKTYRWIDPDGNAQATYSLEDVDLSGTRNLHGPVTAEISAETDPATTQIASPSVSASGQVSGSSSQSQAVLLSQFNRRYGTALPARMIPHVVKPAVSAPLQTPQIASGELNNMAAAKISVQAEGWYSVTGSQLAAAGFNTGSNAQNLKLYAEGVEQPLLIASESGNAAGPLGANDSIQFYGTPIDTPFSGTRVYWLVNSAGAGKRVIVAPAQNSAQNAPQSFLSTVVLEQRTTYFAALLNGENNDNFFGATVSTEPVDQVLTATHIDPTSNLESSIDVTLQGVTDGQIHTVSVVLNGATLGSMTFEGEGNTTNTFPVLASQLVEGANTVTLTALNGDNDVSLVQSIALHYPHTYAADSGWLEATAPAGTKVTLAGFASPSVQVFDITDPLNTVSLPATSQVQDSAYSFTVVAPGAGNGARTLLAFSSDQIASPVGIVNHAPNSSITSRDGTQEIIVTTEDFQSALAPLLALRSSEARDTQVVLMDQLYDEYNYGERSPFALKQYLEHAYVTWRVRAQDVLLVGTASVDPRNYLGFGSFDFVPTRLIETQAFKTASDDWLTDFSNTGFATIPTGRLPVRTAAEASLVISKIVNYERGSSTGSWNSQALFVADQNVGVDFTAAATTASALVPGSVSASHILANTLDPATAQQQILAALNAGPVLVNYSGHGAEQQWSFADLFDDTAAAGLTNGNRLPVYVLMDCLNGFFHDVYAESLSTSLMLAPNGGAVAVWASSGFTTQPPQAVLDENFLRALAATPDIPLGRAAIEAKASISDPDVRRTWILFGDPAMHIAYPGTTSNVK